MQEGPIFRCQKHRKEAFSSKQRAQDRLEEILSQDDRAGTRKKPHRVHYDSGCKFWHLTSTSRSREAVVAEEKIAKQEGRL